MTFLGDDAINNTVLQCLCGVSKAGILQSEQREHAIVKVAFQLPFNVLFFQLLITFSIKQARQVDSKLGDLYSSRFQIPLCPTPSGEILINRHQAKQFQIKEHTISTSVQHWIKKMTVSGNYSSGFFLFLSFKNQMIKDIPCKILGR